jgi:hypothetical protein
MTDDQKSTIAAVKAAITEAGMTWAGTPADVRATAVKLKQELRRDGITARALAALIGVHESTLSHWERVAVAKRGSVVAKASRRRGAGFRRVHVTEAAATTTSSASLTMPAPTTSARGLRVAHAPSGLVVDGLDVAALAVLLKRMS